MTTHRASGRRAIDRAIFHPRIPRFEMANVGSSRFLMDNEIAPEMLGDLP
jgi:hypothetical protein